MAGEVLVWQGHPTSIGWIVTEGDCHIWQGDRHSGGYGRVRHQGRMQMVYRVRYEMEIGPIPDGLELDHYVCDNGPGGCCNPHHCRPVTTRENNLRGVGAAARSRAKDYCPRGHPLVGNNLDSHHASSGNRSCKTCTTARNVAYKRAQRDATAEGQTGATLEGRARALYLVYRDEEYALRTGGNRKKLIKEAHEIHRSLP